MTHTPALSDSRAQIEALLALWQERSRQTGWRRASDWPCRAAHAVATSLVQGQSAEEAFRNLASRRAFQGVGIVESFNDIRSLEVVWYEPLPAHLVDGFLESWVEATNSLSRGLACVDAVTGLASLQHFESRVLELVEDLETTHAPPVVAVYSHSFHDLEDPVAFMLSIDMGRACNEHMPGFVATYQGNQMTLLLNTHHSVGEQLERFGNALRQILAKYGIPGDSLRLAIQPVPRTLREIQRLLGNLGPHTEVSLGAAGFLEPVTPGRNTSEHFMKKNGARYPALGPTKPWHESCAGSF